MLTFSQLVDGYLAHNPTLDAATLSRLNFWVATLGRRRADTITPDCVEAGLGTLAQRGKLKSGQCASRTRTTGQPLAPSTMNRYLAQVGTIYKYAKAARILPRAFQIPSRGIARAPELPDPNRYIRPEEFTRILAAARVIDKHWRKMPALIVVAYHTGLRVGNLLELQGKNLDLGAATISVHVTKNGHPITASLSTAAVEELKKLPKVGKDELVFGSSINKPFKYRMLWLKICAHAKLPGRRFHELRHGHGFALAMQGVSQQMIMASMGHRTLIASARYAHANIQDKKRVISQVFG